MAIDDNTSYELTGAQVKDLANKIKAKAADNTFVGATSAIPGSKGLVPAPQAGDDTKFLAGDGTWQTVSSGATYTAGTGIDITSNVISATNTGKAKLLTTADYNYSPQGTTPYTYINLHWLEPGIYITDTGVSVKIGTTTGGGYHPSIYVVTDAGYAGSMSDCTIVYKLGWQSGSNSHIQLAYGSKNSTVSQHYSSLGNIGSIDDSLTSTNTNKALSAKQGKVLKDLIDSLVVKNAGAPTTSTAGTVGKLYEDTTNGKLYICTDATNPYVWTEVGAGGASYTAGAHIDITGNVISAEDYISADSPTAAVTPSSPVTTPMIADGAVTAQKIATGVVPIITMTETDPGEGSPLAANNFIAVYGDDPSSMNYSLTEARTGATWIDGKVIYKKTISTGALPNTDTKTVAHNISNIDKVLSVTGFACSYRPTGDAFIPLPFVDTSDVYLIGTWVNGGNIMIRSGSDRTNYTESYVTLYYTKSS